MSLHQSAHASGSLRFFPRYIVPALLLGTLAACGGGGGGGSGVATLSEYRHWLGSRLQTDQSLNQQSTYALKTAGFSLHMPRGLRVKVLGSQ